MRDELRQLAQQSKVVRDARTTLRSILRQTAEQGLYRYEAEMSDLLKQIGVSREVAEVHVFPQMEVAFLIECPDRPCATTSITFNWE